MPRHLLRFVLAGAGLALAFSAGAQTVPPPRSFAVVSEMARQVSVITAQESTGSRLGANLRSRIDIPEGLLDKAALFSARGVLQRSGKEVPVWLIAPLEADLFSAVQDPAEGDSIKLPPDLAAEMASRRSTHLLLMQRFRGEAKLKGRRESVGTGQLDGLGFYIDRNTPMLNADSGAEIGKGYIAPYVYVRLSLVDAASGRVLRTRTVAEGTLISSVDSASAGVHPWDAYTAAEKVDMLSTRLVGAIETVLPEMLDSL